MYDDESVIPLCLALVMSFCLIVLIWSSLNSENQDYGIPMCDEFLHGSQWSVSTGSANNYAAEITNEYVTKHWHNVTVDIHNDGVADRVLAWC